MFGTNAATLGWHKTTWIGGADADAENDDADTDDWSFVLMMLILMTMLMMLIMLMALIILDDSGSLFLSPLPHLRETARIRRLVCFSQTCLLFVFREEGGVEFLLHYLPKWRGGG